MSREILVSSSEINRRVIELTDTINRDYSGREIDLVCLSNSGMTFSADLVKYIKSPVRQHVMAFSSYKEGSEIGEIKITLDVNEPLIGRHVLVVEGVVVTGRTPLYIMNLIRLRCPASLEICSVAHKPKQLSVPLNIKYSLFSFDKEWVAGYGIGDGPEKASSHIVNLYTIND